MNISRLLQVINRDSSEGQIEMEKKKLAQKIVSNVLYDLFLTRKKDTR